MLSLFLNVHPTQCHLSAQPVPDPLLAMDQKIGFCKLLHIRTSKEQKHPPEADHPTRWTLKTRGSAGPGQETWNLPDASWDASFTAVSSPFWGLEMTIWPRTRLPGPPSSASTKLLLIPRPTVHVTGIAMGCSNKGLPSPLLEHAPGQHTCALCNLVVLQYDSVCIGDSEPKQGLWNSQRLEMRIWHQSHLSVS